MQQTYRKMNVANMLSITKAETVGKFFGVPATLTVHTHAFDNFCGIGYEFLPYVDPRARLSRTMYQPMFRIWEGEGTSRRYVEQALHVDPVTVEANPIARLVDSDEVEARQICQGLIQTFEALFEHIRTSVVESFTPAYRQKAIEFLEMAYGKESENLARNLLARLNWQFLLMDANPSELCKNVITFAMEHNFPRYYSITSEGHPDAKDMRREFGGLLQQLRRNQEEQREAARKAIQTAANMKAAQLLKLVCGNEHYTSFVQRNHIAIEERGWKFKLAGGGFVTCWDPEGRKGSLCIHSANFACNTIDEIVIAYLYIKHKFEEYMGMAIVHAHDDGFSLAEFKKPRKLRKVG